MNRRSFLQKSSVGAAGAGVFSILPGGFLSAQVAPSDKINIGLIGCRGHGFKRILLDHLKFDDAQCVALCDVDQNILDERANTLRREYGQNPKLYTDFRELLEDRNVDAVIIGTPDHWHCLNFVYAAQAGKDIYVEKPLANTIGECDIMVRAANRYNVVVQVGQQQRSNLSFKEPVEMIKNGEIGALRKINIWANFYYGIGTAFYEDQPSSPAGVDYDFWLGPAPKRPFNRARFHGSWRHFWDYGGGLFSDWGVHLIDMGLWPDDLTEAPKSALVFATNNSKQQRMRETFDTMTVVYPKDDYVINYDMTAGVQVGPWDKLFGVTFIGDKGTLITDRAGYMLLPEYERETNQLKSEKRVVDGRGEAHKYHVRNFLDCIKSREKPVCTPEMGRAAALHAHFGNIAARTGSSQLNWDDENGRFINNDKANELVMPEYRKPWELPKI